MKNYVLKNVYIKSVILIILKNLIPFGHLKTLDFDFNIEFNTTEKESTILTPPINVTILSSNITTTTTPKNITKFPIFSNKTLKNFAISIDSGINTDIKPVSMDSIDTIFCNFQKMLSRLHSH